MTAPLDGHRARGNKIPKGPGASEPAASKSCDGKKSNDASFMNLLSEFDLPKDEVQRMRRCVEKLQKVVTTGLGADWAVEEFGSVPNGFGTRGSDLDVTVVSSQCKQECDGPSAVEVLRGRLQPALQEHPDFVVVQEIYTAKVPILKLRFEGTLAVDVSYQNVRALRNTRLLKAYASLDPAVQGLVIAVKLWAKASGVCGAAERNLSSYAITLMVIYHLQVWRKMPCIDTAIFPPQGRGFENPILPAECLQWQASQWGAATSLVQGFFSFYVASFNWGFEVVSIRLGTRRLRNDEPFHRLPHRQVARLHIEDPYEVDRNLHCVLGPEQEEKLRAALRCGADRAVEGRPPLGLERLWGSPLPASPPFQPSTPPPVAALAPFVGAGGPAPWERRTAKREQVNRQFGDAQEMMPPSTLPSLTFARAAETPPPRHRDITKFGDAPLATPLRPTSSASPPPAASRSPEAMAGAKLLSTTPMRSPPVSPVPAGDATAMPERQAESGIISSPTFWAGAVDRMEAAPASGNVATGVLAAPAGPPLPDNGGRCDAGGHVAADVLRWLGLDEANSGDERDASCGGGLGPGVRGREGVGGSGGSGDGFGAGRAARSGSSSTCAADSASAGAQTDSDDAFAAGDSANGHESGLGDSQTSEPQTRAVAAAGDADGKWWQNLQSERVLQEVQEVLVVSRKVAPNAPPSDALTEAKVSERLRRSSGGGTGAPAESKGVPATILPQGGRPLRNSTASVAQKTNNILSMLMNSAARQADSAEADKLMTAAIVLQ